MRRKILAAISPAPRHEVPTIACLMRALLIAAGNRLRRDDGVAHMALEQLGSARDVESCALLQLTPEVAEDIAGYDAVVFIDSDTRAADVRIEPLDQAPSPPALTHVLRPVEIVGLSRALFGFTGRAFLCRIPVDDLSSGERPSHRASELAVQATGKLENLLGDLRIESLQLI